MDIAVKGKLAFFYDPNMKFHVISHPLIFIEDNKIASIGKYSELKSELSGVDKIIGNDDSLIIPGLINTHTHLGMTMFRGLSDELPLNTWLEEHIWPLEKHITSDDVVISAKVGAIESALSGVTTINSMYWYPESEAKAIEETKLRAMLGAPILANEKATKEAFQIARKIHNTVNDTIRASITPHAPYTVPISQYQEIHQLLIEHNNSTEKEKEKFLMHTHLAEPTDELSISKAFNEKKGEEFPDVNTPVEFFDKMGILDDNLLAAHCIHVTERDIQLLVDRGVRVSLNPLSNSKLGNHMPPIPKMLPTLKRIGLGTDGPASNNTLSIFDTIRYMALYYKGYHHDPTIVKAQDIFRLATIGGAKVLKWQGLGTLEVGSLADLITIDLKKPHLSPSQSKIKDAVMSHFAYAMNGCDVSNTIIDGELVVEDSQLVNEKLLESLDELEKVTQRLVDAAL